MKHTKIILLTVTSIIALFSIEGCTIKSKEQTKQAQTKLSPLHQPKKTKKP